ncbi:UNVERIFIED_CONTAM: hypothetical protein FKN15_052779 [Acipenser sinensis]
MYLDLSRFTCFSAVILVPHVVGELLALWIIQNLNLINSRVALLNIAGILADSGFTQSGQHMTRHWPFLQCVAIGSCYGGETNSSVGGVYTCDIKQGIEFIDRGYPGALSRYTLNFLMLYAFLPALVIFGVISFKIRDYIVQR